MHYILLYKILCCIADILQDLFVNVEEHHMVRLSINSSSLHHEIWVPFMKRDQLDADRILTEVDRVIESNKEWLFDDFSISFVHAPIPAGGGYGARGANLETYLRDKGCFIQIPKDHNNMCCAKAIVTAQAMIDKHPQWNSIRVGCAIQTHMAADLQRQAGIPEGTVCGRNEWQKFQAALGDDYQLCIYSRDFFNALIYSGSVFSEKQIHLYLADNHFSVINSMPAFLERTYFCNRCFVGYSNLGAHTCKDGCKQCKHGQNCAFVEWRGCGRCHRYFKSQACYEHHLQNNTCHSIKACQKCGITHSIYRKHKCHHFYCRYCKKEQPQNHQCYIQPTKPKKKDDSQVYLFYDFECMLDDTKKHIPNLCVVHKVCGKCIESPIEEDCTCEREQFIFKGESTLDDFCEWLFSGDNKGSICIGHNAQAYDVILIMEYIHKLGIKPEVIQNGSKIMSLQACGLRFIDSLNFFNTSLANLPALFGLNELHKGFFPHLFSTRDHQGYKGDIPDVKFYNPDGMKEARRTEFFTWYRQQKTFDFQADLEKYCISDVDILQRACGRFRTLFLQHTGCEPFVSSITIASACNEVYRSLFLKPKEIAIIPQHGYVHDNQSGIGHCWLEWEARHRQVRIQHAFNGGELTRCGIKIDGVDDNGVLYQFHGCFWHGHCFKDRDCINPVNGMSMNDLYQRTLQRSDRLRSNGYTLVEKFECEFREEIKQNPELKEIFDAYQPYQPLEPRSAFYGGRVNAIRLFYEPEPDEQIRYVDFTSLYPYICKYGLFPVGHAQVYWGDNIPDNLQGLIKCKVLPPARLYHPLLPCRINGKLMFPLCYTCAVNAYQVPCQHSDEERAFVGTWVNLELQKAIELGYKIVEKYSAWHFPNTTQYNPVTGEGGLWADYINMWLKLKQEADGYPAWCQTEEDRREYVSSYFDHEKIKLDPAKIQRNEGLRSLSKVMLNSHWGKFGQRPNKDKLTYVADPSTYIEMMTSEKIEVTDLMYVNQENIGIRWRSKDDFVEALPNTNVVLAAYTTAQARLKLYELLERLQERTLYFDTDSVLYIHREDSWNPPLGDYLGELKDETKGIPIVSFVSGGAKSYSYKLVDGTTVCKIKGFTLNYRNSVTLNFETLKTLVTTPGEAQKPRQEKQTYEIVEPHKITRTNGKIVSQPQNKLYRLVYDKRMLTPNLQTYPFGWK